MSTLSFADISDFDHSDLLELHVGLEYRLGRHHSLKLSYDGSKYSYLQGDKKRVFTTTPSYDSPNGGGLISENNMLTF